MERPIPDGRIRLTRKERSRTSEIERLRNVPGSNESVRDYLSGRQDD